MPDTLRDSAATRWLAAGGAVLSLVACYGTLALIAVLSLIGISLAVNVQVWAAAIVGFALIAVIGIAVGRRGHGRSGPLVLAVIGALLVALAMYGVDVLKQRLGLNARLVELFGFAALFLAVIWDWRSKKVAAGGPGPHNTAGG